MSVKNTKNSNPNVVRLVLDIPVADFNSAVTDALCDTNVPLPKYLQDALDKMQDKGLDLEAVDFSKNQAWQKLFEGFAKKTIVDLAGSHELLWEVPNTKIKELAVEVLEAAKKPAIPLPEDKSKRPLAVKVSRLKP